MVVTILTFGAHPVLAYGTLLVFKTLRVGFPTARVEVYDNGSHPEVAAQVRAEADRVGASFTALPPQHYATHYQSVLRGRTGPVVILDPDVVFWSSVEGWDFGDALMAGRLMPERPGGVTVAARLHPSLLWIPDAARLDGGGIHPRHGFRGGRPRVFDTFADLYQANVARCVAFDPGHLDCYDHLFFGTHLPVMDDGEDVIRQGHRFAATGDLDSLRGIWRDQEAYFAASPPVRAREWPIIPARAIQEWQGMRYPDAELGAGLTVLHERLSHR